MSRYNIFVVEINPFTLHDKINTINGLIKDTQHGHESDCNDILGQVTLEDFRFINESDSLMNLDE